MNCVGIDPPSLLPNGSSNASLQLVGSLHSEGDRQQAKRLTPTLVEQPFDSSDQDLGLPASGRSCDQALAGSQVHCFHLIGRQSAWLGHSHSSFPTVPASMATGCARIEHSPNSIRQFNDGCRSLGSILHCGASRPARRTILWCQPRTPNGPTSSRLCMAGDAACSLWDREATTRSCLSDQRQRDERRLRFAAGRQHEYIAQPPHGSPLSMMGACRCQQGRPHAVPLGAGTPSVSPSRHADGTAMAGNGARNRLKTVQTIDLDLNRNRNRHRHSEPKWR